MAPALAKSLRQTVSPSLVVQSLHFSTFFKTFCSTKTILHDTKCCEEKRNRIAQYKEEKTENIPCPIHKFKCVFVCLDVGSKSSSSTVVEASYVQKTDSESLFRYHKKLYRHYSLVTNYYSYICVYYLRRDSPVKIIQLHLHVLIIIVLQ